MRTAHILPYNPQILGAYGDEIVGRPKTQRWSYAWETLKESIERIDISLR